MMDRLMQGISDIKLEGCVNIIIVADHGMIEAPRSKYINLQDYIDVNDPDVFIRYGAFGQIRPSTGDVFFLMLLWS